jgi:hypothetical protein
MTQGTERSLLGSKKEGGTLCMKIITFQKKSTVGNDTLFTLFLLLKEFFV